MRPNPNIIIFCRLRNWQHFQLFTNLSHAPVWTQQTFNATFAVFVFVEEKVFFFFLLLYLISLIKASFTLQLAWLQICKECKTAKKCAFLQTYFSFEFKKNFACEQCEVTMNWKHHIQTIKVVCWSITVYLFTIHKLAAQTKFKPRSI